MAVGKWHLGDQPKFLPPLAGLAGGKPPAERIIDGKQIWPLLSGRTLESPHEAIPFFHSGELHGLRSGKWKLLTHPQPIDSKREKHAAHKIPVLFDLEADPAEATNLADAHPDIVARLQKLVETVDRDLGAKNAPGTRGAPLRAIEITRCAPGKECPAVGLARVFTHARLAAVLRREPGRRKAAQQWARSHNIVSILPTG